MKSEENYINEISAPKRSLVKDKKHIDQSHREIIDLLIRNIKKIQEDLKKGKKVRWIKPWTAIG
ncbi:MAG: hypothetical protein ACTSPW_15300, partial [Promethearchaeota archaeon]